MKKYIYVIIFSVFLCVGIRVASACESEDVQYLKKWVGKSPFDELDGTKLFDSKQFLAAFKHTVNKTVFDEFINTYKDGGRYFQSGEIKESDGVITIMTQSLTKDFKTTFFINEDKSTFDVCWNSSVNEKDNFIYLDGNKKIQIQNGDCENITTKDASDDKYYYKLVQLRDMILGKWVATNEKKENGNTISLTVTVTVTGSPTQVGVPLDFEKTVHLELSGKGAFSCSNKKTIDYKTTGHAKWATSSVFWQDETLSDTKCGKKDFLSLEMENGKLVNKDINGKATSMVFARQ